MGAVDVLDRPQSQPATHWDPFEGSVTVTPDDAGRHKPGIFPAWLDHLSTPLFIIALVGFGVMVFMQSTSALLLGGAMFMLGVGGNLVIPQLTGTESLQREFVRRAAFHMGFSFREDVPEERRKTIRLALPDLFELRIAGSIPMIIGSEMWGTAPTGGPMWMSAAAISSTSFFGGPKQDQSDSSNPRNGNFVMMIAAYELERDTGIEVKLMPEFKTAVGPLDRDIKTESVDFNRRFNIRLHSLDGAPVQQTASAELFRVLTPAFQDTLGRLADEFGVRVIVRGNTVFMGGFRNLRTLNNEVMETFIKGTVERFAHAAVGFKHYAE